MSESIYTLQQRRMRDVLNRIRDFDSLKEWLDEHVVGKPVRVSDFSVWTVDQRKAVLRERSLAEYQSSLERGFTFDGGTFPATGPKRARVTEYVASINAGKGLPQGKSTLTFRDMDGVGHDLGEQGIIDLGAAGSDIVDQADDNYESLMASIEAASSQIDLDAIDPSSGWPN